MKKTCNTVLLLCISVFIVVTDAMTDCDIGFNEGAGYCKIGDDILAVNETRALTSSCTECICSKHYWICCGMGFRDISMRQSNCFMKIYRDCCYQYVKTYDESIPCTRMMCLQKS